MHNRIQFSALQDATGHKYLAPSSDELLRTSHWRPSSAVLESRKRNEEEIVFELARTSEQLAMADSLVERQYRFAGFHASRQRPDDESESPGLTLLAMHGTYAAATVTMRVDTPTGLLADTHYGDELAALRSRGARLCEFNRFAASTDVSVLDLVGKLLGFAWHLCHEKHGVTDVVVECHPRHAAFYRRTLGFQQAGPLTTCSRVGAPAVLLHLPLAHIAVASRHAPRVASDHPSMRATRSAEHLAFS